MSDKEDRKLAKKTLKTAKKGSAAYIEAMGILSGDDPEKREYRKTTRNNNNKTNPYKDVLGLTGYVMGSFPETMMDIEDAIGFGKGLLTTTVKDSQGKETSIVKSLVSSLLGGDSDSGSSDTGLDLSVNIDSFTNNFEFDKDDPV